MPIGDEIEAIIGTIVLQSHPIRECAKVIADVHASRRPHPAQDSRPLECGSLAPALPLIPGRQPQLLFSVFLSIKVFRLKRGHDVSGAHSTGLKPALQQKSLVCVLWASAFSFFPS